MPKLSDTMTTGTLVRWLKQEGDLLKPGDLIAEVETDKATMELENFESGILLRQYVQPGAQVGIGAPICAVGAAGESAPELGAEGQQQTSQPALTALPPPQASAPSLQAQGSCASAEPPCAAQPEPQPSLASTPPQRIKASPLAKKLASQRRIDLGLLRGTGPGGRIVRSDVEGFSPPQPDTLSAASPTQAAHDAATDLQLPISAMRSTIARRLLESKTQVPHFYLQVQVDAEPMMTLRRVLNEQLGNLGTGPDAGLKLTVNDFILRACALALAQNPAVNASWLGSHIQQHGAVHLAFGVALDDGLVTPVIRDAHHKSLKAISLEAKSLIRKAKDKKLSAQAMTGSTFTVTNLGMLGIEVFYGIINPPNAGILSVGATVATPVVDRNGQVVAGHRMTLGFSGDHRVIDGAVAAQFLGTLRQLLENPALLLLG
jgi:pyruvate dehydrogenase E2 component (dihydrolipoamide acetyltransferase)